VMIYNDAYSVFAGSRHPKLLGSPVREGWPEVADFNDNVMRTGLAGKTLTYKDQELTLYRSGLPEQVWMNLDYSPILDESGTSAAVLAIVVETTAKVKAEQALIEANRRKDEFLAMLAHELRNPLAPIATASSLLARAPENVANVRAAGEIIGRQVRHMSDLVDDLLDVSRVTRGLIQLQERTIDMKEVVHNAVEQSRSAIESRRHTLSLCLPSEPVWVRGDHTRLVQVVCNLLNNAAKYTPPGGDITVALTASHRHAEFTVSDNGVGIDADLLPHVFELFTQGERTPDRAQGGLGIGLALVRALVALHEGEVKAFSDGPGRGSRFTIVLPEAAAPREVAPAGHAAKRTGSPLDILVTDDNVDAAQSLAALLELDGHRVRVCLSGGKALDAVATQAPDVCILDVGLPDITGLDVARKMRDMPALGGCLLIALTGYGQPHDREATLAAGFDHHMVKPVNAQEIFRLLESRSDSPVKVSG
jgi:signal transduction histidine kinase/ActR/RegA family two-component response regulator